MARGWESKSVEAQIEDSKTINSRNGEPTPVSAKDVHKKIRNANLHLSRKRIVKELESSTNERYSEMLRRALAELDGQLDSSS